MSKGYLVMAQGGYIDHAIALAESIRDTQSTVKNISIITDQKSKLPKKLFDKVISLNKKTDLAKRSNWKIENRCRFYELTPYDETVILDADMLFLDDVSHWWAHFGKFDMLCTNKVKTYRNEWVVKNPYRITFVNNELPNVYSAFTYFKKSELAETVFEVATSIITNWDSWIDRFAPEDKQQWVSLDVALALAIKVLGVKDLVTSTLDYPTFTHMKAGCQGWNDYAEDWRVHLGVYNSNGIRLGNHLQSGILHYVEKDFLNELNK